ncbi:hypothetical protein [Virgibacillus sp. SK37]|uniref:hypothetical protein n=1 Tax=Virgibacillus sp. SK37 TaxID=403957 RepID=UPI0004D17DD3|nr:hypothetical protein [Virgibacillus sp. SK37]AIF45404.1 hypothetical protein X953_09995 [Virgibacillus sp. SK37]
MLESNIIIQKNDALHNVYSDTYTKKIQYLEKIITTYETESDIFNVLDFEAGFGKSRYSDLIIKRYIEENAFANHRKFLVVKRFNSEAEKSAATINELNWISGNVAVAITAENWKSHWKLNANRLKDVPVLFISHQRYIDLCLDDKMRKIFTEGRHTLIVDEKVNFPIYTYSDRLYSVVREVIPFRYRTLYDDVCCCFQSYLANKEEKQETNTIDRVRFKVDKTKLDDLLKIINELLVKKEVKGSQQRELLKQMYYGLPVWLSQMCIYNSRKIVTNNPKHQHWGLNNNIILDATASLDGVYYMNNDKYRLIKQGRMIDHNKSTFTPIIYNSSKSNVLKDKEVFFEEMAKKINASHNINDKTLIVTHKDYAMEIKEKLLKYVDGSLIWNDKFNDNDPDYNNEKFAIAWYGNLIGKNTFNKFDNVWLLTKPNIPISNYLVHYMQYSQKSLGNKSLALEKGKFKNPLFNLVQKGYIASETYQSLKRIQRVAEPKGRFYIVNNDIDLVRSVIGQINDAILEEPIELDFIKERKQTKNKSKCDKVCEYIFSCNKKEIAKSDLKRSFDIKNFTHEIAKKQRFSRLEEEGKIKVLTRKILVL